MGISIEQSDSIWNEASAGRSLVYELAESALHAAVTSERLRAIESLGRSNDPRAVRPLMDLLEDRDPGIRLAATTELGRLKSGRPVDDLIGRLRDRGEQDAIRKQAIVTLAAIRSTGALRGLKDFTVDNDEDPALRDSANTALRDIGAW